MEPIETENTEGTAPVEAKPETNSEVKVYTLPPHGDFTAPGDLTRLNRAQLVEVFNKITGKTIVSFKDHATAVARVWSALTGALNKSEKPVRLQTGKSDNATDADGGNNSNEKEQDMSKEKGNKKAPKAAKVKKEKGERKARELSFTYDAAKEKTPPREGSRRAKAMAMLQRANGATLEQIMEGCDWTRDQAIGALRLLHSNHGYGMEMNGKHIHLKEK